MYICYVLSHYTNTSLPTAGLFVLCFLGLWHIFLVCFELSAPVQVIAWKDTSPKWLCVERDIKLYSFTHSLIMKACCSCFCLVISRHLLLSAWDTRMRWCMLVLCRVYAGSDLESVIEEIRKDVVGRRCRVNITEVEKLALALSQLSRSLASLKSLWFFKHLFRLSFGAVMLLCIRKPVKSISPTFYFLVRLMSPSELQNVTTLWPVQNYTSWSYRRLRVSNLPIVITWQSGIARSQTHDLLCPMP